jgi:membrane protein YqaA with SNARE-associated domain
MKINTQYILRIILFLLFVGATVFLYDYYSFPPDELLNALGISNAYAIMFALSFFGGRAIFSGIPYHAILIVFASGGLNPLLLGIVAATGVMAGDTAAYYLGYAGRTAIPEDMQTILRKVFSFCAAHPKLSPLAFFLYGSLVPFSNDFIAVSMGLARYSFWKVMIPLGLGNLVFNVSLAYISIYGYEFLKGVFLFA